MNLVDELIQALNEEIEALKNPKGRSRGGTVNIFNGIFLRELSGFSIYKFNLENFLTALDDSPAEIEINGYKYSAQILLTQGLEVEIGIEGISSNFIAKATLYTNSWYLLELLRKKLDENKSNATVNFALSESLFLGNLPNPSTPFQTQINYSLGEEPPNDAQKQAIKASYTSPLSVIWGPPGTGKTKTVAKAVEAHINAGRSILFVSHANNAVDEALEDIAEHLKGTSYYQEGKLVRLGKPQEAHLNILEKDYPLVFPYKIADKLGQTLSQERLALENELSELDNENLSFSNVLLSLAKANTLSSELQDIKTSLSQTLLKLKETQDTISQIDTQQERNRKRLVESQSANAFRRFLSGLNPEKIQREIDQLCIRRDSITRTHDANTELKKRLEASCKDKEIELNEIKSGIKNSLQSMNLTEVEIQEQKRKIDIRRDAILSRITEINKELEEVQKKILLEAKLVATTLTKTYTEKQFPNRKFDVLILDEASMAPLPHLYWAVGRCSNSVTIIGDFLQLPPICISEMSMAQRWLARSIFDVLGVKTIKDAQTDERVNLLDTQYRMVPAISEISNRFIYQGILKDHLSTSRNIFDDGVSSSPLVLVETSNTNAWCSQISTGGRFNLYHALVCVTLAKKIFSKLPDCKIGIVTPYAHQARLMNKIAKDWQILDRVMISTIHKFQGGEQRIIIFDTTEGFGLKTAPMLDDQKEDSDALRVINVAITRAKDKLYLVANSNRLLSDLNQRSLLSRIVIHFQQKAQCLASDQLVDNYFTNDFDKWASKLLVDTNNENNPISGELFTEKNFWEQFLHDVRITKRQLIILSPFVSIRRSGIFMDYFKAMVSQGMAVTIYTRPIDQQTGEMANQSEVVLGQLRNIGVTVIERRSMHQKVAIIDNEIAWEGSLNILSHRDTGEQMRRFIGQSTIEEITKNLELTKNDAVGDQTQEPCPGTDGKGCDYHGYLVVRQNKTRGNKFLGCSSFPRCKYTKPIFQDNRLRK